LKIAFLTAAAITALAVSLFAQEKNFVACPIVRDTRTLPCYLAEYEGETYFLGVQDSSPNSHAPQLKHEVLVEGTVVAGPRVCGGIPLRPVAISVMKEVNLSCDTLLPAEPGIEAPPPSHVDSAASKPPQFTVSYAFDDDRIDANGERVLNDVAAYFRKTSGATVKVSGYRSTTLLSNGQSLVEKPGLAEKRAQNIATLLRGLGVTNVTADWKNEAEDAAHRRVTITVAP
jgi:outer membrane protein OmpA-like peptidoglycan-associated protein